MNSPDSDKGIERVSPKHWSLATWLVGGVALLVWSLVAIPGSVISGGGTSGGGFAIRQHGWPFMQFVSVEISFDEGLLSPQQQEECRWSWETLADRIAPPPTDLEWPFPILGDRRFWSDPGNWQYFGNSVTGEFLWVGFLLNLLIGMVFVAAPMALVQFRIKRRGSLFRIKLWESLILVTILWFIGTKIISECRASSREHQAANEFIDASDLAWIFDADQLFEFEDRLPDFFRRLFDARSSIPIGAKEQQVTFDRVSEITLQVVGDDGLVEDQKLAARLRSLLAELNTAKSLTVELSARTMQLVDGELLPNVQRLNLTIVDNDKQHKENRRAWISGFHELQRLEVDNNLWDMASAEEQKLMTELLESISNPENVKYLELGLAIPPNIDLSRFTNLEILRSSDLDAELKSEILRNNPHLKPSVLSQSNFFFD